MENIGDVAASHRASREVVSLIFYCWIVADEIIKIGYVATCDCHGLGQPFSGWFFQAFQQSPYSLWWTYKGIRFLAGPYSLFWWFLNLPAVFGYSVFFGFLLASDLAVFYLLSRRSRLYAIYFLTISVWFTTYDPVDFWIVVFAVAGRYRSCFLLLSPLTKLPVGSEVWLGNFSVWSWVFTSHNSFAGAENWGRYILLGSIWLFSLSLYLWKIRSKITLKISHQLSLVKKQKGEGDERIMEKDQKTVGQIEEFKQSRSNSDKMLIARNPEKNEV
jgi:hypothetical protein